MTATRQPFSFTQEIRELDFTAENLADLWLDGDRRGVVLAIREHARPTALAALVATRLHTARGAEDVSLAQHLISEPSA